MSDVRKVASTRGVHRLPVRAVRQDHGRGCRGDGSGEQWGRPLVALVVQRESSPGVNARCIMCGGPSATRSRRVGKRHGRMHDLSTVFGADKRHPWVVCRVRTGRHTGSSFAGSGCPCPIPAPIRLTYDPTQRRRAGVLSNACWQPAVGQRCGVDRGLTACLAE